MGVYGVVASDFHVLCGQFMIRAVVFPDLQTPSPLAYLLFNSQTIAAVVSTPCPPRLRLCPFPSVGTARPPPGPWQSPTSKCPDGSDPHAGEQGGVRGSRPLSLRRRGCRVSSHLSTPSVHEAAGKVVTVATWQVVRMPAEVPSFLQTVHRHHEEGESV